MSCVDRSERVARALSGCGLSTRSAGGLADLLPQPHEIAPHSRIRGPGDHGAQYFRRDRVRVQLFAQPELLDPLGVGDVFSHLRRHYQR